MTNYRFEIYVKGKTVLKTKPMDLKAAQDFYIANYNTEHALRLFVEDQPIPYLNSGKVLKLDKSQLIKAHGGVIQNFHREGR